MWFVPNFDFQNGEGNTYDGSFVLVWFAIKIYTWFGIIIKIQKPMVAF